MRSDDPAPNRGGSRNFTETQQFLEYTFGPEKSSTLNTYAAMKSGMKRVDSTGRSGPIPSAKAQKRLDDYKALVLDETPHELDAKALYIVGRGMPHGRVPIGDGAVKKGGCPKACQIDESYTRHQATGSSHGYDGEDNANLEEDDDDDHTWCGSDIDDDLDHDVDSLSEADSDDDLEEDGDDTSDEDHYSDNESGGPIDGSGTRATN